MKSIRFSYFSLLFAALVLFPGIAPDMGASQTQGSTSETVIQSVAPKVINLTQGGHAVTVSMTGTALGNITAIQVIQAGKLTPGFETTLKTTSGTTCAFDIKAMSQTALGEYQLRIMMRTQKRDLPSSLASVVVKASTTRSRTAQAETAAAAAPTAQAASQAPKAAPSSLPPKDTKVIRSGTFNSIAMNMFQGAYFDAMSCGGRDSERKTTANVPNAYFKQEPLDRLVYKLSEGEVDRSKGGPFRTTEIRACVDNWRLVLQEGSIEAGRFKLVLKFPEIKAIKTRGMRQHQDVVWSDYWDWADKEADEYIRDYRFSGGVEVFLAPAVDNGGLAYRLAEARWQFYEPLTGWVGGPPESPFWNEVIVPKIIHYKDKVLEVVRQRVVAMFEDPNVRARLSAALTQSVKSDDFAGRTIVSVSGKGQEIEVTFQK